MIDLKEAKELAQILDFRDQSDAANMMRLLIELAVYQVTAISSSILILLEIMEIRSAQTILG